MVNFKALEDAVTKVERIRDHEFCFEVDGTKICMMPLRPDQETEVQKFAQVAMEHVQDGEANQAAFADFMDRMRHASLAFSIVQIGDLDLRDVEYVETGEQDKQGNPISIPKWEAVCELIANQWSRLMLSQVFGKFGEMLDRLELRAQKAVNFDPVDLDEEIDRTERRLGELRQARSRVKAPKPDSVTQQQQGIANLDKAAERNRNTIRSGVAGTQSSPQQSQPEPEPEERAESPDPSQPTAPAPPQPEPPRSSEPPRQPQPEPDLSQGSQEPPGRRSAIPSAAPPPQRPETQQESEVPQQPEALVDERGIMLPNDGDSFFDPSDPGQAMEIEARRQAMLHQQHVARQRAKAQEEQMRREMGIPTAQEHARQMQENQRQAARPNAVDLSKPAGGAAAGVRQAANLHNAVFDGQAGSVQTGRPQRARPQPGGQGQPAQLHGKPVFKMPTQTLDRSETQQRKHGEAAPGPVQMNPAAGGKNPNFRPKDS